MVPGSSPQKSGSGAGLLSPPFPKSVRDKDLGTGIISTKADGRGTLSHGSVETGGNPARRGNSPGEGGIGLEGDEDRGTGGRDGEGDRDQGNWTGGSPHG